MVKSEVKGHARSEAEYPKLGVHRSGAVVLFVSNSRGMVVAAPAADHTAGFISSSWDPDDFKPFHGTVTLSNA